MNAKSPSSVKPRAENLTAKVRLFLSRRLVKRVVTSRGLKGVFLESQSRKEYTRACDSWHEAYWNWVEQETSAEDLKRLKGVQADWSQLPVAEAIKRLQAAGENCSELPSDETKKKRWLEELFRQESAEQLSVFRLAMRGPESEDPETYTLFMPDMAIASQIGVNTYSELLARQKQRKPTKDKGDRRLKSQLLVYWIPGCLWAFTADGIAQFLNVHHPRSANELYQSKTISDAWRDLKLYRSPRPLWWGISGPPPRLVPLK